MAGRPAWAFVLSLIGGAITLVVGMSDINEWYFLHSTVGGFSYSSLGLGSVPSAEAIYLFIIGGFCGASIIVGSILQYSGGNSKVRVGSILVLVGSIVSIPTTYFGVFIGGALSVTGGALGLAWKPSL